MVKICEVEFPTELGKCDIIIEESNSDIAYFVIKNSSKEIRIDIFEPEYYGDNDYVLNDIEKEVLVKKLNEIHILAPEHPEIIPWEQKETQWSTIAFYWDDENEDSNYKQKDDAISNDLIPNYMNL